MSWNIEWGVFLMKRKAVMAWAVRHSEFIISKMSPPPGYGRMGAPDKRGQPLAGSALLVCRERRVLEKVGQVFNLSGMGQIPGDPLHRHDVGMKCLGCAV